MADPLSVTASVLAVTTTAIAAIRSLCDTIKSFRSRDKTLQRLQETLQHLTTILESLEQVINADTLVLTLLEGPIDRCKEVCNEFEQSMKKFHGKSKTGLLDWTKLEFMRGDINEFIGTIDGYKSTITVGLGTINLRNSKVSHEVLQKYEDMIKDTTYLLELHLQRIDEKLTRYNHQDADAPDTSIDLRDERAVTHQCLRVCKDASSYIESLASRESILLQDASQIDAEDDSSANFEAQVLMRQALNASQANFLGVINSLNERLQSVVQNGSHGNEKERLRLQEDINISKQCLDICKVASEVSRQKIHRIGEAVAEDESDQVVVTTLADLFDVRKALSRGHSAQLVATLTPENFDLVIEKRYNSRFGAVPDSSVHTQVASATSPVASDSQGRKQHAPSGSVKDAQSLGPEARRERPSPNEMRKRFGDGDSERKAKPSKE